MGRCNGGWLSGSRGGENSGGEHAECVSRKARMGLGGEDAGCVHIF